jgi:hypothetical protein
LQPLRDTYDDSCRLQPRPEDAFSVAASAFAAILNEDSGWQTDLPTILNVPVDDYRHFHRGGVGKERFYHGSKYGSIPSIFKWGLRTGINSVHGSRKGVFAVRDFSTAMHHHAWVPRGETEFPQVVWVLDADCGLRGGKTGSAAGGVTKHILNPDTIEVVGLCLPLGEYDNRGGVGFQWRRDVDTGLPTEEFQWRPNANTGLLDCAGLRPCHRRRPCFQCQLEASTASSSTASSSRVPARVA